MLGAQVRMFYIGSDVGRRRGVGPVDSDETFLELKNLGGRCHTSGCDWPTVSGRWRESRTKYL